MEIEHITCVVNNLYLYIVCAMSWTLHAWDSDLKGPSIGQDVRHHR